MTTLDSLSAAESSMDDTSNPTTTTTNTTNDNNKRPRKHQQTTLNGGEDLPDNGDPEVWASFNTTFREVQSVLDRNRALIQQVNENHQSKVADNMLKNVALIQEINGNISKVASLYSDLSANFSSVHLQRNKNGDGNSKGKA